MTAPKLPNPRNLKNKLGGSALLVLLWWLINSVIQLNEKVAQQETKLAVLQDRNERKENEIYLRSHEKQISRRPGGIE